jgi:uncharacterized repeat protein (TIGR01451 family)
MRRIFLSFALMSAFVISALSWGIGPIQSWAAESWGSDPMQAQPEKGSGRYPYETTTHPMQDTYDRLKSATNIEKPKAEASDKSSGPVVKNDGGMMVSSVAYPTGRRDSSILWIEKHYPSVVRLGEPYKYIIKVTNLSDLSVPNVGISEQIPDGFKVSRSSPEGEMSSGKIKWDLGTFDPRETKAITIEGEASDNKQLPCCTAASYDPPTLCVSTDVREPSIKVDLTATPNATLCEEIALKFTVTNTGDSAVNNVIVKSQLPNGVTDMGGRNSVAFNVGALDKGASRQVAATVRASKAGDYSFSASAVADGGDISANSSTQSSNVVKPSVSVSASAGRDKQFVGREISYDFKVTNTGDTPAKNTVLEGTLPASARFVSATNGGQYVGGKVRWNVGNLNADESKTVSVNATAVGAGEAKAQASVGAYCADVATAMASTEIVGIPAVLLEVVDVEDPIEIGQSETYVITVTNQGTAPDTNIKIVAEFEDGIQYVSSSGATTGSLSGNEITFSPLKSLAPKANASWNVVVKGQEANDFRFRVTLTSDQLTRKVEETESTHVY